MECDLVRRTVGASISRIHTGGGHAGLLLLLLRGFLFAATRSWLQHSNSSSPGPTTPPERRSLRPCATPVECSARWIHFDSRAAKGLLPHRRADTLVPPAIVDSS